MPLSLDDVKRLLGRETRQVAECCSPPLGRASTGEPRRRFELCRHPENRDAASMTVLEAEESGRELCHRQQACSTEVITTLERALDATSWLKALPQVDELTSHLGALKDERCS